MDTKLFLMLVVVFLLGYYSRQLCSSVVEGLTCGTNQCNDQATNGCKTFMGVQLCDCKSGYGGADCSCGLHSGGVPGNPPCCSGQIEVKGKCYTYH